MREEIRLDEPEQTVEDRLAGMLEELSEQYAETEGRAKALSDALGSAEEIKALKESMVKLAAWMSDLTEAGATPTAVKDAIEKCGTLETQLNTALAARRNEQEQHAVPGFDDDPEAAAKFNCLAYMRGAYAPDNMSHELRWEGAEFERDVCIELMRKPQFELDYHGARILTAPNEEVTLASVARGISDARGSVMFPVVVSENLIDLFWKDSVLAKLGYQTMTDLGRARKYQWPRLKTVSGGAIVAEGGVIASGDQTFDNVEIEPFKVAGRWQMTNEAIMNITPQQDMIFRNAIMESVRQVVEALAVDGTGSSQPSGIAAMVPSGNKKASGTNGDAVTTPEILVDLIDYLDDANVLTYGGISYLIAPILGRRLATIKVDQYSGQTANKGYLLPMSAVDGWQTRFLGYPFIESNQVKSKVTKGTATNKTTSAYLGKWNDNVMAVWRPLRIAENPWVGTAWTTDSVDIRIITEVDFGYYRPQGMASRDGIIVR